MLNRIVARLRAEKNRILDGAFSCFSQEYRYSRGVLSMPASIANLKKNGFRPGAIIDIGAYQGEWTRMVHAIYPETPIMMLEANPEKQPFLEAVSRDFEGLVRHRIGLLGASAAESVPYYVMESGSSVLPEQTTISRSVKSLPMTTVDESLRDTALPGPYLIKLDVQGYELEVLEGARRTVESAEVLLLEVALLEYNAGAPLLAEVVAWMASRGFLTYDVCGFFRRESDQALYMLDLIFARADSQLRARKFFWRSEMTAGNHAPHKLFVPA